MKARIIRAPVIVALLAAGLVPFAAGASLSPFEVTIDRYIKSFPKHEEFGGVILVAEGGRILFHRGYGLASREFGILNGEKTRFQVGSITKAFTSMLVLKLVEEGTLDLDRSISDYLPYYPAEPGRSITIRHLLSNTSGMPHHHQAVPDYFEREDHYFHTPRELISLFWTAPLMHKPGERFTYSSPGFYVLGAILQQATGKSYAELLREYILGPLGMNDTFVENNRTTDANLATGYIRGLAGPVKSYVEDKSTALAAGDLISTAHDLYLWQKTLRKDGDRILSKASKQLLFQPVLPDSVMTFTGPHFLIPYDGGKKSLAISILSGSSSGYASCLTRQTGEDRCVIVLSNIGSDDVSRIADDIGDIRLRRYLGIPIGEEAPLTRTPPAAVVSDPSLLSKIPGFYRKGDGAYMGVVRDEGRLFCLDFGMTSGIRMAMELIPLGDGSFQLSHNPSFHCAFSTEKDGAVSRITASRKGRTLNEAIRVSPEDGDSSEYAGSFTSLGLQTTSRFFADGGILAADGFPGESRTGFVRLETDLFGFSRGFLRFFRDRDGALAGFEVFTKDTDKTFGSKFIKIAY